MSAERNRNNDYWKRRYERDKAKQINQTEDFIRKSQQRLYQEAEKEIQEEVEKLYQRFADAQNITLAEAKQLIRGADFKQIDFDAMVQESLHLMEQLKEKENLPDEVVAAMEQQHMMLEKKIAAYTKRGEISYLELRSLEIDKKLVNLYNQNQATIFDYLKSEWDDEYYRQIFNTQQYIGFGKDFVRLNDEAINRAILNRYDKWNYSKSLYAHCSNFSKDLRDNLVTGLIRGENLDKMAGRIHRRMGVAFSAAKTLVRTETAYVFEQSTMAAYKECDVEWYEFLATLDGKTSEVCQNLDGKHFKVKDAVPGKNCPPMHPNCRSTTVCWFPDEEKKKAMTSRLAKDDAGKYYEVPANITYQLWKENNQISSRLLTHEEHRALNQYMSFESYVVNDKLRNGKKLNAEEARMIRYLDAALNKLDDYKGTVVRCIDFQDQDAKAAFLEQHQPGVRVTYKAYTSSSTEEGYNPDADIRIYRKSSKGKRLISLNSIEKEVLYKRNSSFVVKNVIEQDGITYILEAEDE